MYSDKYWNISREGSCSGVYESTFITADGPAGLRISRFTTLLPCGTAIACTFNDKLIEELLIYYE